MRPHRSPVPPTANSSRRRAAPVVALLLALAAPAAAQNELGNAVYQQNCAACHGELAPPQSGPVDREEGAIPAYYSGNNYLLRVSPEQMQAAILYGVPGAGMTGFGGALSSGEIEALMAYIYSFER